MRNTMSNLKFHCWLINCYITFCKFHGPQWPQWKHRLTHLWSRNTYHSSITIKFVVFIIPVSRLRLLYLCCAYQHHLVAWTTHNTNNHDTDSMIYEFSETIQIADWAEWARGCMPCLKASRYNGWLHTYSLLCTISSLTTIMSSVFQIIGKHHAAQVLRTCSFYNAQRTPSTYCLKKNSHCRRP